MNPIYEKRPDFVSKAGPLFENYLTRISETIGERHASACRYRNAVPEVACDKSQRRRHSPSDAARKRERFLATHHHSESDGYFYHTRPGGLTLLRPPVSFPAARLQNHAAKRNGDPGQQRSPDGESSFRQTGTP